MRFKSNDFSNGHCNHGREMILYNGWCPSDNARSRTARAQHDHSCAARRSRCSYVGRRLITPELSYNFGRYAIIKI